MIPLKNDKVVDFSTWLPTDFLALNMFTLKMLFNFLKTGYHITTDDVTVTFW